MKSPVLPDHFQSRSAEQQFSFACHSGVPCFTECCRELDLALTPYDVLRLRRYLGLSSDAFLERYVIVEWDEHQNFPTCYLTMVDDGRASCVFLEKNGCTVYADRPGSCRAYPVGRGVALESEGRPVESLVLIQEPHCRGFAEACEQTIGAYLHNQGLPLYNQYNDALLPLLQHARIRAGSLRPSRQQLDQYMLALYDLDQFRREIIEGRITLKSPLSAQQLSGLTGNDEELLLLGIRWLIGEVFTEESPLR